MSSDILHLPLRIPWETEDEEEEADLIVTVDEEGVNVDIPDTDGVFFLFDEWDAVITYVEKCRARGLN